MPPQKAEGGFLEQLQFPSPHVGFELVTWGKMWRDREKYLLSPFPCLQCKVSWCSFARRSGKMGENHQM